MRLNIIGLTGGFIGSFVTAFFLDLYNTIDLLVPPLNSITWACTCGFLGLSVINSILITEKLKRNLVLSVIIYFALFVLHALMFKLIILGVGKLFVVAGCGLGSGILLGRYLTRDKDSRVINGFLITALAFIFSFLFIGFRYYFRTSIIFHEPIDIQIWFSWTVMCTWIAFFISFESYIS